LLGREHCGTGTGTSTYRRSWSLDPLGRVLAEFNAQGAPEWRHAYDANGNRTSSTDPFGAASVRAYDART
jgi:YD repeat-containing protein